MDVQRLESLLACATDAAQAAGRHALDHYNRRGEIVSRTPQDVKLRLDLECQEQAAEVIRRWYPGHTLLGEEGGEPDPGAEFCWVVDPIDGTVNFFHGLPFWCSSVAVLRRGRAVAGAVYLPMLDELFTATESGPARRNGEEARVSAVARLADAAVAVSAWNPAGDGGRSLDLVRRLLPACQKIRIFGSAAADLCYLAFGRIDGYAEATIHLWDVAAGGLLVTRAGGRVEILDRPGPNRFRLFASNGNIHGELRGAMTAALRLPGGPDARCAGPDPWAAPGAGGGSS